MAGKIGTHAVISTAATTQVKTGRGILHHIVIGGVGTTFVAAIYDDTGAGTAGPIGTITCAQNTTLKFGVGFQNGLKIVTTGTPGNITVVYE
jgi:hypothetical protein